MSDNCNAMFRKCTKETTANLNETIAHSFNNYFIASYQLYHHTMDNILTK